MINPKDIKLSIMEGISMELDEYVTDFFATLHEGRVVPGCVDSTNYYRFTKILNKADAKSWLVKFIHDNPTHEFNTICIYLIKRWTSLAAETFPKCAKKCLMLSSPSLFLSRRYRIFASTLFTRQSLFLL